MSETVLVARRLGVRAVLAAVLAVGLIGIGLSVENPQWFSGSSADAGLYVPGSSPFAPFLGAP